MALGEILRSPRFAQVILVLWLVSMAMIGVLLFKIDQIVHGDLYNYGLQFSVNWAFGYWAFVRLIAVCFAIPSILSAVALVAGLRSSSDGKNPYVPKREIKTNVANGRPQKENHMVISCPKCKKMFSKPLAMLDFSHGKAKLVNVCPYCNNVLNNEGHEDDDDIHIADPDRQEMQKNRHRR